MGDLMTFVWRRQQQQQPHSLKRERDGSRWKRWKKMEQMKAEGERKDDNNLLTTFYSDCMVCLCFGNENCFYL